MAFGSNEQNVTKINEVLYPNHFLMIVTETTNNMKYSNEDEIWKINPDSPNVFTSAHANA